MLRASAAKHPSNLVHGTARRYDVVDYRNSFRIQRFRNHERAAHIPTPFFALETYLLARFANSLNEIFAHRYRQRAADRAGDFLRLVVAASSITTFAQWDWDENVRWL
jgi:hypothetical protein